jgi:hypothetical protein
MAIEISDSLAVAAGKDLKNHDDLNSHGDS